MRWRGPPGQRHKWRTTMPSRDRRALSLLLPLLCAGFATGATPEAPSAQVIVEGGAEPIDYSQAVRCIAAFKIERTEPLNERYILFHLNDDTLWLAQMRTRCPGVTPSAHLAFDQDESRLCEWDTVRVVDADGAGGLGLGPRCNLPKFDPVSAQQVEMLKQQIRKPAHPPGKSQQ